MDPQPSAPPVVAVVVTCDPGPWLEETLSSLAGQDYPNLSVLVIDAASTDDPTARVAAVLPTAYVRRLAQHHGFGRAANEVLRVVDGASHFLFCHDDVAPAHDAVRIMLEEAFRSNAGIVCPKLVEWDRPERLLSVGQSADKVGVIAPLVERGEFDQEQYDAVRDVFCAPGGCTLVRADLFATLGGYDRSTDLLGEDLDLSWRAQVAGARVLVAPEARVRHLEALTTGQRAGWDDPGAPARAEALSEQHRIRTLLTCYSGFHLVRVLPQAIVLTVAQALVQLLSGHPRAAGASLAAWRRAVRRPGQLRTARRAVRALRTVPDAEVRRLQTRGSARVRSFLRDRLTGERAAPGRSATVVRSMRSGSWRIRASAWAVVGLILLYGTRGLLGHQLPGIGLLPVVHNGPAHWWRLWLSGWRPDGLGSPAPAPPALALLGLAGTLAFGAVGVVQQVLVLGPLLLGPLGAYRAARTWGSARGQAAALIVYAAVPLPYNALAAGRWPGLVLYAAAPWMMAGLIRGTGQAPVAPATRTVVRIVGLALVVALTAAWVPAALVVVPLIGAGLLAGSILTGRLAAGIRALAIAVVATGLGWALLAPWSADVVRSRTSLFGVAPGAASRLGVGEVLTFRTGPIGAGPLTWGLVLAAALPLVIGRGWRLVWAARLWGVAAACWGVVWAASRGSIPLPLPTPEVLLAPAAAALAGAAALGAVAFEQDLSGFRFGWRQLAPAVVAAGVVLASLPVLAASVGGRWHLPDQQPADALGAVAGGDQTGGYRVLWVGDPRSLPLGSWWLEPGVGYATSDNGMPDVTDLWPPRASGATPLLGGDLRLARDGQTTALGHLLAPLAIRYIVIPDSVAPAGSGAPLLPQPLDLLAALGQQVDLRTLPGDPSLTVYENSAWAPQRSVLPRAATTASLSDTAEAAQGAPLGGSQPVLGGAGPDRFTGLVPGSQDLMVSATDDPRWTLSVAGRPAPRRPAFGWAMAFAVPGTGGPAVLRFDTPTRRYLEIGGETLLWLLALAVVALARRRRRAVGVAGAPPWHDAPEDLEIAGGRREPALAGVLRRHQRPAEPPGFDPDEEWPL